MRSPIHRKHHKPLLLGLLTATVAGIVSAQSITPPDKDAAFRQGIPAAASKHQAGLPGGIVTLHTPGADRSGYTLTPIKHVILLIGENRTFDHIFATYTPPRGQSITTCCPKASSTPTARPVPTWPKHSSGRHRRRAITPARPRAPRHSPCCRR
ncbi:hypothetical protein [Rhodanobacter sp. BL-MT-08]